MPPRMDALLLLAPTAGSIGYAGRGDFAFAADGRLRRRAEREVAPFVFAGAAILAPALFKDAPKGEFPLTDLFDRAAEQAACFGLRLEGLWMHVGTPDAIALAENADPRQHKLDLPARGSVYDSGVMPAVKANVFTFPASAPFLPSLIAALARRQTGAGLSRERRSAGTQQG